MSKKTIIAGAVIIFLLGVLFLSMEITKNKKEPISVSLNQEFELRIGEEAIFNGIRLAFEGYETKESRGAIGGLKTVVAKFKASLDTGKGGATWFDVEEVRGVNWAVTPGSGNNADPNKEEFHIFTVQFVKKVSNDSIRISIPDFNTIYGREAWGKWVKNILVEED